MNETTKIIITNEIIINFYEKNKQIDIVKMNLMYIELYENMISNSINNSSIVNTIISILNTQTNELNNITTLIKYTNDTTNLSLNNIKSEISNIISLVQSKLYELKDDYMKQFRDLLNSSNNEINVTINKLLDNHNLSLSDRITLLITEVLPKTQSQSYINIINEFKTDIISSLKNVKDIDPNIMIDKINIIIENKYSNINDSLNNYLIQSENRLNTNILSIKDLSIKNNITQDTINEELNKFINKHNNSAIKGQLGENLLYNVLINEFPSADIQNTSNLTGKGDFIISRKNKNNILIETKEYTDSVKKSEVEKFLKDVNSNDCHGIFMSQKSGIVNKENYQIDINNKNILIYIHFTKYEPYKISLAVKIIDLLSEKIITTNTNDIILTKDTLKDIKDEYENLCIIKNKLISDLKDYTKKTLEYYENITLVNLEKYLSKHYAIMKKNLYLCEYCKINEYINLKSLARHKTTCRKKHPIIETSDTISDE